jgi:hypothetical protein
MMKSLTTFTAIAALIAGVSIASAQNAATPSNKVPPPSSINAGKATGSGTAKSGSESTGAAHSSMSSGKMNVTGKSKFCISTAPGSNGLECKFASMAACEKAAKVQNRQCQKNPKMAGTTGMKQ